MGPCVFPPTPTSLMSSSEGERQGPSPPADKGEDGGGQVRELPLGFLAYPPPTLRWSLAGAGKLGEWVSSDSRSPDLPATVPVGLFPEQQPEGRGLGQWLPGITQKERHESQMATTEVTLAF